MASKDVMRDISRRDFCSFHGETIEAINAGSLQRIADATEKMAQDYDRLKRNAEMYERWYREQVEYSRKLERSKSALRGVITKLNARRRRLRMGGNERWRAKRRNHRLGKKLHMVP